MTLYAGPTRTRMNPHLRQEAEFFDPGQTIHILRQIDTDANREWCFTTFGGPLIDVGDEEEVRHGWDGPRYLGTFRCIGTVHEDGRCEGEVESRSLPHWVAK